MDDRSPPALAEEQPSRAARGVAASAVIVGIGQLLSRLMGLLRVTVVANVFGATAEVSSFNLASKVPTMFYDLLLGGMVTAALVPVLSEYLGRGDRQEFERLASTLITLVTSLFVILVIALEFGAPLLAIMVGGGQEASLLRLTTRLIQLILPALAFLGAWGVTAAVLFARQQFVFPALASAVFNLGVILSASLIGNRIGATALSLGVVLGSVLQLVIILPGLRGLRLRPRFDLHHPALRRIVILYLPVIASLLVANLGIVIDANLASRTSEQAVAWMDYATRLIQLPLGLVSVAIATAALPALARLTDDDGHRQFRRILAGALRLVLVLIIPATVALIVLGREGIRVFLERGAFTPYDTYQVTWALLFYLPGLPFAAIDQPLVFAFYARNDTVTPVLIGVAGVGAYLLVGPLLAFAFGLGFIGLVIANAVQLTTHCVLMWVMLQRKFGSMAGLGMLVTAAKSTLATCAMGLGMIAVLVGARTVWPAPASAGRAALLLATALVGVAIYIGGLAVLRVDELAGLLSFARGRLRGLARNR